MKKRDGSLAPVSFDAIQMRIREMLNMEPVIDTISPAEVCKSIMPHLYNEICTEEIDQMIVEHLRSRTLDNPDYEILARRLHVNNNHKRYKKTFSQAMLAHLKYPDIFSFQLLDPAFTQFVREHNDALEEMIVYERDYDLNLRSHLILENNYLLRAGRQGELLELPQQMYMRVAVALWCSYFPFVALDSMGIPFLVWDQLRNFYTPTRAEAEGIDSVMGAIRKEEVDKGERAGHAARLDRLEKVISQIPRLQAAVDRERMEHIEETYDMMSRGYFIHATPILMSAGYREPSLLSCFILRSGDSVDSMYRKVHECALIQKSIGGIGMDLSNIRPAGSVIRSTGSDAAGLLPYMRVLQTTAKHIQQGGKRRANHNYNLSICHKEATVFLEVRSPMAPQEAQLPDAHVTLWLDKYFFECVDEDQDWHFFDPLVHPEIFSTWGDERKALIQQLVAKGQYEAKAPARQLWAKILKSEWEGQEPFLVDTDNVEALNVQSCTDQVRALNLCVEMTLVHDENHTAVCCLGSLKLSSFYDQNTGTLDLSKYVKANCRLVQNLNRVLDINHYPSVESRRSAMKDRPLGIGVQDLAGLFMKLDLPYASTEAKRLAQYLAAVQYVFGKEMSMKLAKQSVSCFRFPNMPAFRGRLKPLEWRKVHPKSHEWLVGDVYENPPAYLKNPVDIDRLLAVFSSQTHGIPAHGLRNSTLEASMPTVSTAQILASVESFEPVYAHVYVQHLIDREHLIVNPHLVEWLRKHDFLHSQILHDIKRNNGSIRKIRLRDSAGRPADEKMQQHFQDLFTCWTDPDFDHFAYIDLQAARAMFIDQSLSMNHVVSHGSMQTLNDIYRYASFKGLPTLSYYTRKIRNDQALDHLPASTRSELPTALRATEADNDESVEPPSERQVCGDYCGA